MKQQQAQSMMVMSNDLPKMPLQINQTFCGLFGISDYRA
jgi:hypothetical protein